jgi:hypothetical protein
MDKRSGGSSVKLSQTKEDKDSAGVTSWHLKIKNRSLQRRVIFVLNASSCGLLILSLLVAGHEYLRDAKE